MFAKVINIITLDKKNVGIKWRFMESRNWKAKRKASKRRGRLEATTTIKGNINILSFSGIKSISKRLCSETCQRYKNMIPIWCNTYYVVLHY